MIMCIKALWKEWKTGLTHRKDWEEVVWHKTELERHPGISKWPGLGQLGKVRSGFKKLEKEWNIGKCLRRSLLHRKAWEEVVWNIEELGNGCLRLRIAGDGVLRGIGKYFRTGLAHMRAGKVVSYASS